MAGMTRRGFFGATMAAGALAARGAPTGQADGVFAEPARNIPVDDWADVIVVGQRPRGW